MCLLKHTRYLTLACCFDTLDRYFNRVTQLQRGAALDAMASFNKYPSTQAIHFISSLIRDKTCPLLVQPARTPAARCLLIWWQLENIDLTRLQCQHQQPSSQRSHAVAFQLHVRCNSTVRSKNRVYFCVSDNLGLGLNSSFSLTTHGIRIRNIKAPEAGYMNLCFF